MLKRSDFFMVIAIIWLSAFSFLKTSYNDITNYIYDFNNAESLSAFLDSGELFDLGSNPLHDLYRVIIHEYTDNYHIYFMFPAILNSIAVVKLYKRYSDNSPFSLIVFLSLGTYVMFLAAIKQSIAVAILLCALPYAIDKKYVRFYALVIVAMMFHTHAFMFMIVPFLFNKPWGVKTWALFGAVLFAMVTYDSTFGFLMNIATNLGVNIVDWELFDGHQINYIRILVYGIPALMALVFRGRLFDDSTRTENLFVNMSIVSVFVLSIGLIQGANLFARMAAYFEIFIAISLPWMIGKIFTKESAKLITFIASLAFFGYFVYEHGVSKSFDIEYRAITIWQFINMLFA